MTKWDTVGSLKEYHRLFDAYLSTVNSACDAEMTSYDGAVLFTGRSDELIDADGNLILYDGLFILFELFILGGFMGYANTGKVCKMYGYFH